MTFETTLNNGTQYRDVDILTAATRICDITGKEDPEVSLTLSRMEAGDVIDFGEAVVETLSDTGLLHVSCWDDEATLTRDDLIDLLPDLFPDWSDCKLEDVAQEIWDMETGDSLDLEDHHIEAL